MMENNVIENTNVEEMEVSLNETEIEAVETEYDEEIESEDVFEPTENEDELLKYGVDGLVNEENASAFKFLNLKSQLTDISKLSDQLKERSNYFINSTEAEDDELEAMDEYIENAIDKITEDEIKEMSDSDIDDFLTYNGTPLTFTLDFDDEEKYRTFKRDYLLFRKRTHDAIKSFDVEIEKINNEISKSQAEFDEICNKYSNITNLVIETLKNKYETEENEEKKDLYKKLLDALDYALNLNNLKEYLRSYRGRKILSDFKFPKSSMEIYRKYKKVNDSLNVKIDLKNYPDLESKVLGEEYNKRPNIILFSMMHFIASQYNKDIDKSFGVFINQFTVNLRNLWYDKFDNEEEKAILINAFKEIIDIIG